MIEVLAVIPGSVAALVAVAMDDHHLVILGVAGCPVARSADLRVAALRRGRRIVYHHIVDEPVPQQQIPRN